MLSRLSDFVVCGTNLNIWSSISNVLKKIQYRIQFVEIQYVNSSDHINTIFKHCHAWVISENTGNLLIFREIILDVRPKSVCAVMTMYVH